MDERAAGDGGAAAYRVRFQEPFCPESATIYISDKGRLFVSADRAVCNMREFQEMT